MLSYAHVPDCHLLPRLGATAIRDINPALVLALQRDLRADGVGGAMTHRILMVLSGIMRHAVLRGRIDRDPVQPVRVVQPKRRRAIRPSRPPTSSASGGRTILVEQSADGSGAAKATKTGSIRTVALLAPLAEDLTAWRTAGASEPDEDAPIVPRADGTMFTATGYRY